jgi:CheY-like chemotaxis protein
VGDAAIHTDAMKLKQVLINLLSNACKFTQNGTISFGVRREHEGGREWLRVAVEDSGIGMTTEQLDRVFVPFVQADATTSRKYGGTGLGLAISKRFVEMMGGEIMAASVPNRGSTFSLRIPVDQVAEAATAEARDTPAARIIEAAGRALDSRRGERRSQVASVLIVEPDPSLRELMERYLSGEGFRVVSSGSGDDIEVLAERHAPVLIVLDLELPAMVPAQLAARLKASRASDIPLIVLGPAGHTPETRTLGAADCLGKPLNWAMLGALSKKWARAGGARVDVSPSLASRAAAGGKSGA